MAFIGIEWIVCALKVIGHETYTINAQIIYSFNWLRISLECKLTCFHLKHLFQLNQSKFLIEIQLTHANKNPDIVANPIWIACVYMMSIDSFVWLTYRKKWACFYVISNTFPKSGLKMKNLNTKTHLIFSLVNVDFCTDYIHSEIHFEWRSKS